MPDLIATIQPGSRPVFQFSDDISMEEMHSFGQQWKAATGVVPIGITAGVELIATIATCDTRRYATRKAGK